MNSTVKHIIIFCGFILSTFVACIAFSMEYKQENTAISNQVTSQSGNTIDNSTNSSKNNNTAKVGTPDNTGKIDDSNSKDTTIYILQLVEHPALDATRQGIID